ncbi:Nuclear pore complex protein NUP1 [Linum perenne]
MAAPTASRDGKDNQPYEDGGGYGKFRKRPFRRSQATPYDRPSTSNRNPGLQTSNGSGNGWFSKLVDPAQKLLSAGAQRFFASVFQKRLAPPPPTRPLEPEAELGTKDKQVKPILKDKQVETIPKDKQVETNSMLSSKVHVDSHGESSHMYDVPSSSNGGVATDLESMLKHKSFTRHEIDRLTALLQSRMVDSPLENGKIAEVAPSNSFLMGEKEVPSTPVKDSGTMNHLISTPIVLDQDVASPAELAKAYMGSRPSKVSPSMLGFPSQPWKEDSAPRLSQNFLLKGPTPSSIYRTPSRAGLTDNGFMTPRSRGRSAVYSMARTPYSRTQSTKMIQTLKRRSSVLDSDIGSTGPIRRIRQKSNLMPSGALSARGTRFNSNTERHLALTSNPVLDNEPSKENSDYSIQNSGFTPVSSKSSQMASKILQQLDVLVSSREKSPTKLSPSKLRGQALRSLEKIDSSKFLESVQNSARTNATDVGMLDDSSQHTMPQNGVMSEQNGLSKGNYFSSKLGTSSGDGAAERGVNSSDKPPQARKSGFRISADEDFQEMDDDDDRAGNNPTGEKDNMKLISSSSEGKAAEIVTTDKPSSLYEVNPKSNSTLIKKDAATNGPILGNSNTFTFGAASSMETVKHAATLSQSAAASDKTASGLFSTGEKVVVQTECNGANEKAPLFSSMSPSTAVNDAFGIKFGASSGSQSESSERIVPAASIVDPLAKQPEANNDADRNKNNSENAPASLSASSPAGGMFSFGSGLQNGTPSGSATGQIVSNSSVVPTGTIEADISVNAVNTDSKSDFKSVVAPSTSIFKFGSSPSSDSFAPTNAAGDSKPALTSTVGGGLFGIAASTIAENTAATPSDIPATEKKSTLINPFGGSGVSSTSGGNSLFGGTPTSGTVISSSPFGGSSFAGTSMTTGTGSGNSLFSSTASSMTTGSSPFSFSFSSKSAPSGVSNQSQSTQVAATGPASSSLGTTSSLSSAVPSFGLSNSAAASGSSLFSSSSASNPFSSGASFGVTSSAPASEPSSVSSNASTSSALFGSSWSMPTLPAFSSVPNSSASSSGFVFGASSGGAATNATSSSPFSFSAPAANPPPPAQSLFAGPSTSFAFGSTPSFGSTSSGNNDQMSMEDSMAEDTVQATTPSIPLFSQPASAPPSSGFVFGSAAPPSAPLQFGGSTAPPSMGNPPQFSSATPQFGGVSPFQFGGQPNMSAAPQQNASPFQASGSLEFNAGGSFSLGAGDKSNRRIVKVRKSTRKK